ncbi:MAG: hypothetical protein AAF961_17710, partial [Planctomycetota bacterium]
EEVVPLLGSDDGRLRHAAEWLVTRQPTWGGELAEWFRQRLTALSDANGSPQREAASLVLENLLVRFSGDDAVQHVLADQLGNSEASIRGSALALRVMGRYRSDEPPLWQPALAAALDEARPSLLPLAIEAARRLPEDATLDDDLTKALSAVIDADERSLAFRVAALRALFPSLTTKSDSQFSLLCIALSSDAAEDARPAAVATLADAPLSRPQLGRLCDLIESVNPLEINALISAFRHTHDAKLGNRLLSSLERAASLPSVRIDLLRQTLAKQSDEIRQEIERIESLVNVDAAAQRERIDELLPLMANGDARRGHAVYYRSKAACATCHRLGYAGGAVGPELTDVGERRTERDLLEAILYPSLSFVQGYEPVIALTVDGRAISGVLREETAEEYRLVIDAEREVR